jgi:hypothetical protein
MSTGFLTRHADPLKRAGARAGDRGHRSPTRATALAAGVHRSENPTARVAVNRSAALNDSHGTAADPAADAALTDPAFVTDRFPAVRSRCHASAKEPAHA